MMLHDATWCYTLHVGPTVKRNEEAVRSGENLREVVNNQNTQKSTMPWMPCPCLCLWHHLHASPAPYLRLLERGPDITPGVGVPNARQRPEGSSNDSCFARLEQVLTSDCQWQINMLTVSNWPFRTFLCPLHLPLHIFAIFCNLAFIKLELEKRNKREWSTKATCAYPTYPALPCSLFFSWTIPELAKLWQSSRRQGDHRCHRRTGKARWAMQSLKPWRNHTLRHIETALNSRRHFKDVLLMLLASIGNGRRRLLEIEPEDRFEQDKRIQKAHPYSSFLQRQNYNDAPEGLGT
jgi:hypothetical protein